MLLRFPRPTGSLHACQLTMGSGRGGVAFVAERLSLVSPLADTLLPSLTVTASHTGGSVCGGRGVTGHRGCPPHTDTLLHPFHSRRLILSPELYAATFACACCCKFGWPPARTPVAVISVEHAGS